MDGQALFDRIVVGVLESAPKNSLKVGELRQASKIRRGITSVLQDMKQRGLVILSSGELGMETQVTLAYGK